MTDKMREEFEVWYKSHYGTDKLIWLDIGEYDYTSVQSMWLAWQGSRDAINVKLPELLADAPTPSLDYHDVLQALDIAGVGYE